MGGDHREGSLGDAFRLLAWSNLARQQWENARALSEAALAHDGHNCDAMHTLALALWGLGDSTGAMRILSRAASLTPGNAAIQSDLGVLRFSQKDWAGASDAFNSCLEADPQRLTALQGRAETLLHSRRLEEAVAACEEWRRAAPLSAAPLRSLARALLLLRRFAEAARAAEQSLAIEPESERGLLLMEGIYQQQRLFGAAKKYAEAAVGLHPHSFEAQARLAIANWNWGDVRAALEARDRALELKPTNRLLAGRLSWLSLNDPAMDGRSLLEIHRRTVEGWHSSAAVELPPLRQSGTARRRLRVGYVSGEFVCNAAYCFLYSWLRHHDADQVETYYYMSCPRRDEASAQYREIAGHWLDVHEMSDEQLAARIREDAIDILVDLSGHFEYNRLPVFRHRPAPVQVTFPNYPSTTGSSYADYILTDRWTTPEGSEDEYAERPYRLSCGYLVYEIPPADLPVTPLPALRNKQITFGMFQRPGKVHAGVWDAIGAILRAEPGARLLVHFPAADLEEPGTMQREALLGELGRRGCERERVVFRGYRDHAGHMRVAGEVDIALDSFPYNGQTTTCDCLWMGVPVVSLRGSSHVARVTPALLERMGMGELVAANVEEYVNIAVRLAADREALSRMRASLRKRMLASPLTDGEGLARAIEEAYRQFWSEWRLKARASGAGGRKRAGS